MSKKISSDELDTLGRSRNTTVVLAASGEVHTNEEAQVYVPDLNPFVTVQLLVDLLGVFSLGKLWEEHGCTYEWTSGQKPRLTKQGKTFKCKTDNFVPLVVPRLSTSSGNNSSSTSPLQDLSSTSPSQMRSDGLAPGDWCGSPSKTQNKNKKRDGNRDLPEWLEEFTDNLEDTEVHAPAHISEDSDSERLTKVVSKSRKHSIYTHFPKDRNCGVCLRTEVARAPCSKLSLFKILPLNGPNPIRAKQRLHKRRKRVYESSSGHRNNQKLLKRTIHWNLENLVKICHGIIEPQHSIDPRRMVLLWERQFEEALLELG